MLNNGARPHEVLPDGQCEWHQRREGSPFQIYHYSGTVEQVRYHIFSTIAFFQTSSTNLPGVVFLSAHIPNRPTGAVRDASRVAAFARLRPKSCHRQRYQTLVERVREGGRTGGSKAIVEKI